jgi:hypothetical protein
MNLQASYIDEWIDKAFQLAYFLHDDRKIAKQIIVRAMNKLETASNAQFKRYYYTPTGRAENSRAARSRVSMNDLQLLQRLVFVESENFEREKESNNSADELSLLTYFIKHLVRISLKRNSFYVTLGVARILHNYGTNDAMEIYNIVVQDPERVHDDYYYRSRKGVLMKELKARFGDLIETVKVNRGEERFQAKTISENLFEAAQNSLKIFTPWKTSCVIPEKFNPFEDVIKSFHFNKNNPDEEHLTEVNRIHAALHPACFARLTGALKLPASEEKMEIPKFMISENLLNIDDNNNDRNEPPRLEANELQAIKDILHAQAESRRAASANLLRVVVDGNEQTKINLLATGAINFDLDDSAEMIEVRIVEKEGETILATHLLSFDDLIGGNQTQTVVLEGGQKVSFQLQPTTDEYGDLIGLNCDVAYAETDLKRRIFLTTYRVKYSLSVWFENSKPLLKPIAALGLLILFVAFGWIFFSKSGENKPDFVKDKNPSLINQPGQIIAPTNSNKNEVKEPETPKIPNNKNQSSEVEANKQPKVEKPKVTPKETGIISAPQELQAQNNNLQPLPKRKITVPQIQRFAVVGNDSEIPKQSETRGLSSPERAKLFNQVKRIYLDISGNNNYHDFFDEEIVKEISKNNAFIVETTRDFADARLKISIRREPNNRDGKITVEVSLHNADGAVIYPTRKNVKHWKYIGKAEDLPRKIIADLTAAKP